MYHFQCLEVSVELAAIMVIEVIATKMQPVLLGRASFKNSTHSKSSCRNEGNNYVYV